MCQQPWVVMTVLCILGMHTCSSGPVCLLQVLARATLLQSAQWHFRGVAPASWCLAVLTSF